MVIVVERQDTSSCDSQHGTNINMLKTNRKKNLDACRKRIGLSSTTSKLK